MSNGPGAATEAIPRWRIARTAGYSVVVAVLFLATSSFATILSVTAVEGVPDGGVVQFGSPDAEDLSIVLQISLPPGVVFSIGGFLISPTITAGGVIPGPYLDVTLIFHLGTATPQVVGT